ncbi:DUF1846 domain-containing protein [Corynebacterium genitalium ATCC 33030]|uniref:Uncharacterized protein n=1 Tax=Corynebacterium genitalium ATCC 33030 TaxID=585529 RepID=D7W9A1_9CORY|nr:DUF1846 domain-containing protein [Corynebacterium genitalium]EFK55381.1 hypothetical protein HMPREF0291_10639 [Corynebacterium genitalium ATCC 33030]UUA89371.1 DUF1846 domain-containing protein [Corynebacterium genitalium ATCC 33030]
MGYTVGFDRDKYIAMQSEQISKRREAIGGKLYLEMGGKLFDDHHASRVLPGFTPDNKIAMLEAIKDEVEIVVCVAAPDLVRQKVRADIGITYEDEVLRLIDGFRERNFLVDNVVITQYESGPDQADAFRDKLEKLGLTVNLHRVIPGYPNDISRIVSEEGFGRNDYVETTRDVVVMTAPGPGSGKMATCLSQVYADNRRGISAGYAKFETFPIWNLPLEHPINLAYEAATVDLDDINVIDQYHLAAYGEQVSSYNRDVDAFPLLKALLLEATGTQPYQSPTDMGVNMAGYGISDDAACRYAANQEIIRRFLAAQVDARRGDVAENVPERAANVMRKAGLTVEDRPVVGPALAIADTTGNPGAALELPDGSIVTGKTSDLLGPSAAVLLNALKKLAGIDDEVHLLSPDSIEPIQTLKTTYLGSRNPRLHTDEVLIALSASASEDDNARLALEQLQSLRGCDAHITTILGSVDEGIFRSLGVLATTEPEYWRKTLYHRR